MTFEEWWRQHPDVTRSRADPVRAARLHQQAIIDKLREEVEALEDSIYGDDLQPNAWL